MELFNDVLDIVILTINIVAVAVLMVGIIRLVKNIFVILFIKQADQEERKINKSLNKVKVEVGGFILLTLEILIAADILETIYEPSLQDILLLAAIVAIRTIISFFLNKEIKDIEDEFPPKQDK